MKYPHQIEMLLFTIERKVLANPKSHEKARGVPSP
jgi:hypothetical protein